MKFRIDKKSYYYIIEKGKLNKILFEDIVKFIKSKPDNIIYKASRKYRKLSIEEFIEKQPSVILFIHKKYESDVNEIINIIELGMVRYMMTLNPIYIYKNIEIRDEI